MHVLPHTNNVDNVRKNRHGAIEHRVGVEHEAQTGGKTIIYAEVCKAPFRHHDYYVAELPYLGFARGQGRSVTEAIQSAINAWENGHHD